MNGYILTPANQLAFRLTRGGEHIDTPIAATETIGLLCDHRGVLIKHGPAGIVEDYAGQQGEGAQFLRIPAQNLAQESLRAALNLVVQTNRLTPDLAQVIHP